MHARVIQMAEAEEHSNEKENLHKWHLGFFFILV